VYALCVAAMIPLAAWCALHSMLRAVTVALLHTMLCSLILYSMRYGNRHLLAASTFATCVAHVACLPAASYMLAAPGRLWLHTVTHSALCVTGTSWRGHHDGDIMTGTVQCRRGQCTVCYGDIMMGTS
jgi:hypothetical protein